MNQEFIDYSTILAHAFEFNPKNQDIVEKKKEILTEVTKHHQGAPSTVLYYGFNPLMFVPTQSKISVTCINDDIRTYLDRSGVKYTYIKEDNLGNYKKGFNWVVAFDEFFTFAKDEEHQRNLLELSANLARDAIITTLRDYKNQDFKDREFSQPLAVYNQKDYKIFLEYHNYDSNDKNMWSTTVHEIQQNIGASIYGPFNRRNMFFKQLAKFSIDAGARNFYVYKNLMYKSVIKKNYEHVISISF